MTGESLWCALGARCLQTFARATLTGAIVARVVGVMGTSGADLGAFLRGHRSEILDAWTKRARRLPSSAHLSRPRLMDWVPELLDQIAELLDQIERAEARALPEHTAGRHALERLEEGFELAHVVEELALLRESTLQLWRDASHSGSAQELTLNGAIDRAIVASVDRYSSAQNRLLSALDRISKLALTSRGLDALLRALMAALHEETPTIDTASILLCKGDVLTVRASIGLDGELHHGFRLRIGEGFAGKIAAERRPLAIASAATSPLLKSQVIRERGVRAMYGVPLIADGELIGVAHMGSTTAQEFSEIDTLLFRAMVSRATAGIYLHRISDTAEQRARELADSEARWRATFDNAAVGIAHVALDGQWLRVNARYCAILGYSERELQERRWQDLTHPDDLPAALELMTELDRGERPSMVREKRYLRKSGTMVWVQVSVSTVRDAAGAPTYRIAIAQDVTDRHAAEEALRVSEERARLAVETTGIGTFDWNIETGELSWSPRCKGIFGLAPDEELDAERAWELIADEDRAEHEARLRRATDPKGTGLFARDHRVFRRSDGQERWVASRARVFFDGQRRPVRMIGTVLDITEERRREQRARFLAEASAVLASSIDYQATLEHVTRIAVPEVADYCVVDLVDHGALHGPAAVACADSAEDRVRAMRGPHPPRAVEEVVANSEPRLIARLDEQSTREIAHGEELRRLGVRSWMSIPLRAKGRTVGALTFAQTKSGRSFSTADLEVAQELASRAAAAIENAHVHEETKRAVQLREQVLGVVSHDLRNPLGVITIGTAALLHQPGIQADPTLEKQIRIIERNASRMSRLIRDLLDMSSIQAGRLALERHDLPLAPILAEAQEAHEGLARQKGVELTCELDVRDRRILCDRDRLMQVLSNLLGNAIKFCRRGDRVTLRARITDGEVIMTVSDTGPGIAPGDLPHVFDLYWQKGFASKGTGLGLFISKGIVEAHDGRIWAESTEGKGSTFTIALPLSD